MVRGNWIFSVVGDDEGLIVTSIACDTLSSDDSRM